MSENKNSFWFYQWPLWLRVVLCVFFWFIFIPILVWPKIKELKYKYFMVGGWVVFVLFVFLVGGSNPTPTNEINNDTVKSSSSESKVESEVSQVAGSKESVQAETETVVSQPEEAKPVSVPELVAKAIPKGCKGCVSELKDGRAILTVDADQETFWDNKHMLETMLTHFIKYGQSVKDLQEVTFIEVYYKATLVDLKGNESDGDVMWISMPKAAFSEYNFNNIAINNVYKALSSEAVIFILPNIRKDIDFEKIRVLVS